MGALSDQGVRVPEQISVVGFDDIPFARYLTPPLDHRIGSGHRARPARLAADVGPAEPPPTRSRDLPPPADRESRQRGAGAAERGRALTAQPDRRLRGLAGRGRGGAPYRGRRCGEHGAGPGARPAAVARAADGGRGGQRTPRRCADPSTALVGRLRPRHDRLAAAPGRRPASPARASSVCTAMAGCARSAPSSWSTSGPARVRGLLGSATAYYSGRAPANELARRGHAVLVHDTFSWGSRRFDLSRPTPRLAALLEAQDALWQQQGVRPDRGGAVRRRLRLARGHAGQGGRRAGPDVRRRRAGRRPGGVAGARRRRTGSIRQRLGTFGFSGGGGRSLLLAALDHQVGGCVVSCMMATFASPGPGRAGHPFVAAPRARPVVTGRLAGPDRAGAGPVPGPVPRRGRAVPARRDGGGSRSLAARRHAGTTRYRGSFHPGGHVFDAAMQEEAWAFLAEALVTTPPSTRVGTAGAGRTAPWPWPGRGPAAGTGGRSGPRSRRRAAGCARPRPGRWPRCCRR